MTCTTCLGRRRFASEFYPLRRPLFVRCWQCTRRRSEAWYLAKLIAVLVIGGPLVTLGVLALVDAICATLKAWLT